VPPTQSPNREKPTEPRKCIRLIKCHRQYCHPSKHRLPNLKATKEARKAYKLWRTTLFPSDKNNLNKLEAIKKTHDINSQKPNLEKPHLHNGQAKLLELEQKECKQFSQRLLYLNRYDETFHVVELLN
jgi:hypothetical protein